MSQYLFAMYVSMLCPKTHTQFLYLLTKKGKSLDPGFDKYLPFWFTSGWRSSMSSCFFCNSSWTSVSFSLSSRKKSKKLWSQTDPRMKLVFCHITFVDCGRLTFWCLLSSPVKWKNTCQILWGLLWGCKLAGTWWLPKKWNYSLTTSAS